MALKPAKLETLSKLQADLQQLRGIAEQERLDILANLIEMALQEVRVIQNTGPTDLTGQEIFPFGSRTGNQ